MWEITIYGKMSDFMYFALLEEELKCKLKDKIVVAISISSTLACSVALKDKRYLSLVKNMLIECILKCVKEEYFRDNICIDAGIKEVIIGSLVYINLQEEIDYMKSRINLPKQVYIRPLIRFRLSRLYCIWEKFAYHFNQRKSGDGAIFLDFLKVLASPSYRGSGVLFLEKINEEMCILDKNREIISITSHDDEIGVVVSLITLAPKKIIINCVNVLSRRTLELINYIFEDRISMLL